MINTHDIVRGRNGVQSAIDMLLSVMESLVRSDL